MVKVEKDLAKQNLGEKYCRCGKYTLPRTKVTKLNTWLPFHYQPSFHVGTWPTGQPPWPHPMLQLWVSSNESCQPTQEGRTWGYHEAEYALDSGKCPQTGYPQEHQVQGVPPMPLTISIYLFSGVEMPRNWESKKTSNDSCFIFPCVIPTALLPHYFVPKNSFLFCFLKGGFWIISAPDSEAWWLDLNSQSAGTQRCPALSCVSVLFLQPDS